MSKKEQRKKLAPTFISAYNKAKDTSPIERLGKETLTNEKLASMSIKEKLRLLASKIRKR